MTIHTLHPEHHSGTELARWCAECTVWHPIGSHILSETERHALHRRRSEANAKAEQARFADRKAQTAEILAAICQIESDIHRLRELLNPLLNNTQGSPTHAD